ncbi:IS1182 family transposase [Streptomyces sp. NBC_01462]|uniref:IS1182 family transposase n=1 Tax=Streptomyces sp. NBC_01462 TaxID=2903876 RepID=UPI002E33B8CB|nr:IS1182 family transposase [Streptomyces sp. NBC_01462]
MLRPVPVPPVPGATARVARAVFRKSCLAMRVRDELGPLFCDEQFASAFPRRGGPALSPGQLAMVSVLQFAEGLTDRQAADAVRARIDFKYCLGLELDDPGFDFSVLSEFRDRLIAHGLEEQVLDTLLQRLSGLGLLRAGGRQRTDATHVLAAVRAVNRMEFVGETMRAALEALAAAAPGWLADIVRQYPAWEKRYGARCDSYRMPKGDNAREEWARTVGEDGFCLLEAVHAPGTPWWLRKIPAVQVLRTAWVQQYHRGVEGVRWREGKDLPPGRIRMLSPYDVQARYSVKRGTGWVGYKVHLSEVCEPGTPHVITNVATTDATVQDTEMTDQVHRSLQKRELLPAEHLVDCGYTSASLLVQARDDYQVNLFGPLRTDTSPQKRQAPEVAQEAFSIDWKNRRVTCPQGHTNAVWSAQRHNIRGVPIVQVFFRREDCDVCPLREPCTRTTNPRYGRGLQILAQPLQEAQDARRREEQTDEFKARYAVRAGVEGTISQAVRRSGIRTTPYTGLAKTHLGHVFTATALNLVRLDAWWTGTPLGATRTSHFTKLNLSLAA